jgi:hypothetical protein
VVTVVAGLPFVTAGPVAVVDEDALEQAVERPERARGLGVQAPDRVHPRQTRHELAHRASPQKLLEVRQHLPQLRPSAVELVAVVTESGARDDAARVGDEEVAQVHEAAAVDAIEQHGGLALPCPAERMDTARAEEVEHAHASRLAPVLTVGREHHVAAVQESLGHAHRRAAGEGQVAGLHGLLRRRSGGCHHGGHASQPQEHDRAVRLRKRPELPVWQGSEER